MRRYPINPTYAVKEDGILSVIDGVQRLSCVHDFLVNDFTLSNNIETILVNSTERHCMV